MIWTDEQTSLCRKLWGEGHSAAQIARAIGGVTRNAVIGKVHRLGLARSGRAASLDQGARLRAMRKREDAIRRAQLREEQRQAKRVVKPEPLPAYEPIPPLIPGLTCVDATPTQCRFIPGDPAHDPTICGRETHAGSSFCRAHFALCYKPEENRAVKLLGVARFASWSDRNRANVNMAIFGGGL